MARHRAGGHPHEDGPDETVDHFRAWVGVGIALVSILGAVVVWRASLVSAEASDTGQEGIQQLILQEQLRSDIESGIARDSRLFVQFQEHVMNWRILLRQAGEVDRDDPALARELRDDARGEISLARGIGPLFQPFSRPFYGDRRGFIAFDPRVLVAGLAEANLELTGLAPERTQAEADDAHRKALHLVGIAVLLAAALLFLTFAQVGRGGRGIFAAAGGAVAVVAAALFAFVELMA